MRQRLFLRLAILLVLVSSLASLRAQYSAVRINEILSDNSTVTNIWVPFPYLRTPDLVELYNTSFEDVDISGCSLSDSNTHPQRYIFPPGSVVPAGGFLVIPFDSVYTNVAGNLPNAVPFGIKATGGYLHFYDPSIILIDEVEYGLQLPDRSIVRTGPTTWSLGMPSFGGPNSAVPLGTPFSLRINEWMADGSPDYFELYNRTNRHVPLGGMYLSDKATNALQYQVAPLSFIGTGEQAYVVFKANGNGGTTGTTNRYPADQVNFNLSKDGNTVPNPDIILVLAPNFQEVDRVIYGSQQQNISEGWLPDGNTNNRVRFPEINDYDTASPGDPNFLIITNVYVNELLSHTDPPQEDVVEFYNRSASPVDISGWWLSNARGTPKKYLVPPGPPIPPGGYRTIYEGFGSSVGFNSSSAAIPFTFNSARGDNIVLSQTDGGGNLTGHRVYETFEAAANGISFGYYKTSVPDDYKFVAMETTTFGQDEADNVPQFRLGTGMTNSYPKIGPIVINEILYATTNSIYYSNALPVFGPNPADEFIELRNVTSEIVPLYDPAYPTNHWVLQKAVEFVFPLTNLAPNSFCLVVAFNPTNATELARFRNLYKISNNVPIFGPWSGSLNNGGDAVELYKPDPVQLAPHPDAGFVPYIRVDKVNYKSNNQWPLAEATFPNPLLSLQRRNSLAFGNDPINWAADQPTAGTPTPSGLGDSDADGMPNAYETRYSFNSSDPFDAALDADGDTMSNLEEYVAGTNPRDASSVLKISTVSPSPDNVQPAYIHFYAYSNATYTVEYRKKIDSNWKTVTNVNSAPFDRWVAVADQGATNGPSALTNNVSDRYYRIVAPAKN